MYDDDRLQQLCYGIARETDRDPAVIWPVLVDWFNQNMELVNMAQTFTSEEYSRVRDKSDFRKYIAERAAANLGLGLAPRCAIVTITKPPKPVIVEPYPAPKFIEFKMQFYALKRPSIKISENWLNEIPW